MVINEIIANKLPFLNLENPNVLGSVNLSKTEILYLLEPFLNKATAEDESLYTEREKILVATYTAYNLLITKTISTVAGDINVNAGAVSGNKILTKAKADVVESEFDIIKSSDGANISMDTKSLLATLKDQLCSLANSMNIGIAICNCDDLTPTPFIMVRS